MKPTALFGRLLFALAAVFLTMMPGRILAQDIYTEAGQFGPFWSQSGNWSNGVPTTGTTAILGENGTTFVQMDLTYSGPGIAALLFEGTLGTSFELDQISGAMIVSGSEVIGNTTAGNTYFQQAGTNQAGSIIIGNLASTSSANANNDDYTITGGSLQVGNLTVGNNGNGSFTLVSGSVGITSSLIIGSGTTPAGDSSIFSVIGGVLNLNSVGQTYVGEFGSASFVQVGGSVTGTSDTLYVGGFGGSSGSYLLNSGTLTMMSEGIGFINNAADTASFTQNGGVNDILAAAYVAQGTTTTTGTYVLNGGTVALNSGAYFYDGASGKGLMNQSSGSLTGSNGSVLVIGFANGSNATYNLSGGSISVPGELIGEANGTADTALFAQTGGTNEILNSGTMEIGVGASTTGTYTLSGSGTLLGDGGSEIIVGAAGKGLFNQSGGVFTGDTLIVGNTGGSNGVYNLSGGSMSAGLEEVGDFNAAGNNALFAQTGGTNSVTEDLVLGYHVASSGTYTLSGNGVLSLPVGSALYAGFMGAGLFQQSGGTVSGSGALLVLGEVGGSSGIYNLSGGLLSVSVQAAGDQNVAGNTAAFIQSGGTNAVLDGGKLFLGFGPTSTGTYALSNGTVTLGSHVDLIVGNFGAGYFNQTGGSVSGSTGVLEVSASGGSTGVYNLSGGAVSLPSEIIGLSSGTSSEALFAQTGGTNTIASSGTLELNGNSGAVGTYTLGGGVLALGGGAQIIVGGSGAGVFTQSGGVLSGSGGILITGSGAGNGTYNLNGGTLIGSAEYVGYYNAGTVAAQTAQFIQTGGTNMITPGSFLVVGFGNSTTTGTYMLSGSGVLALGNGSSLVLGDLPTLAGGNTGSGTFVQNGGIVSGSSATIFVGNAANFNDAGISHYSLHGGYLLAGTENIGYFTGGNFLQDGGTNEVVNNLNITVIPGSANGFGSYTMGGGLLLLDSGAQMQVGAEQTGSVTQSAGTVSGSGATVNVTSAGTYTLNGGALTSSTENIGIKYTSGGPANFAQTGGTNTIVPGGQITVGAIVSSVGTYSLNGNGTLVLGSGANLVIGGSGAGTFTQSGGAVTGSSANLIMGQSATATGTYNLSGGSLVTGFEEIGDTGTGAAIFTQTGGTNTMAPGGGMFIAFGASSAGTYSLSGSGVLNLGSYMIVGISGTGAFMQSGGTVNGSAADIFVGEQLGSTGVYNLSGGSITAGGEYVGFQNSAAGDAAFIQTGGTNFIAPGSFLTLGYASVTSTGTYALSGSGVLQVAGATTYVGQVGSGAFNQSGGVVSGSGGTLIVGDGSGSSGTYNLSGGTITSSTEEVGVQNSSTDNAVFAQTGGTNAITPGGLLVIATNFSPSNGSYILSGSGMLTLGNGAAVEIGNAAISQIGASGIGTFTQNGGTVSGTGATIYVGYTSAPFAAIDTYNMNAGYLLSGTEDIGYHAEASFTQTGGTNEIASNGVLAITAIGGSSSQGLGQYFLEGIGVIALDAGAQMKVGDDQSAAVFQSSGSVTGTAAFLRVYSGGLYDQTGGSVNMGTEEIGEASPDNGLATYGQTSGTNSIVAGGQISIGGPTGGNGVYNLSGTGLLALGNGSMLVVGGSGAGTFTQSGGGFVSGAAASVAIATGSGSSGTYDLNGGTVNVASEQVGGNGVGSFVETQGSNVLTGTLGVSGSGSSYAMSGSSTLTVAVETYAANTAMMESGGSNTVTTRIAISGTYTQTGGALIAPNGAGVFTTQPGGTYVMQGTAAETGELDNFGAFQRSGGSLGGTLFNYNSVTVSGTQNAITFSNSVTNEAGATFAATNTNVSYGGSFLNHGAYVSSGSSAQTFTNLTTDATGWMAGGGGDQFTVTGGIFNSSTNKNSFNLGAAKLTIAGVGTHNFGWTGANLGATTTGYTNNFAIGVFEIQSGAMVNIANENGTGSLGIYVNTLLLDDGLNGISEITGNGADIFYNENAAGNGYLNDGTYALNNGGFIEPVVFIPEPGLVGLLVMGGGMIGMGVQKRRRRE